MRIGLSMLFNDRRDTRGPGGTVRYCGELLRALVRLGRRHEFVVYLQETNRWAASALPTDRRVQIRRLRARHASWHRMVHVTLPQQLARDRINVLHAIVPLVPLQAACPLVVTILDLIPLAIPQGTIAPRDYRASALWIQVAAQLADHIITPSRATEEDVAVRLGVPRRQMTTIPLGPSAVFRPGARAPAAARVRQRFGVVTPYLLTVGDLVPRKNHRLLIEAFQQVARRRPGPLTLVIAGRRRRQSGPLLRMIGRDARIRYVGVVSDGELRNLYVAAEALGMPSAYEGFGLPALEAMACGTPVVAFRRTSLPEVIGPAGLLVNEMSSRALAAGLRRLLEDPPYAARLRQASERRAQQFSWARTAAATVAVYERVVQDP